MNRTFRSWPVSQVRTPVTGVVSCAQASAIGLSLQLECSCRATRNCESACKTAHVPGLVSPRQHFVPGIADLFRVEPEIDLDLGQQWGRIEVRAVVAGRDHAAG